MDAATIQVLLKLQDEMSGPLRQAVASVDQIAPSAQKAATQTTAATNNMQQGMKGFADSMVPVPLGMAAIGAAAAVMAKAAFNAASDMQENVNKVDVVFGQSATSIKRWADDAAVNLGMSESAALKASGTFGNLFVSMGFAQGAASDMSMSIVQLASDLASFNNISVDEALVKLQAGLVGEVEPLRSLGVNLSAAAVQAKALEMGLADNAKALTAADKAAASYQLILEQTGTAQGDFARNAEGAANSIKQAEASIDDLKAMIGQGLVPVVGELAREVTKLANLFKDTIDIVNDLGGKIPGLSGEFDILRGILANTNPILSAATAIWGEFNKLLGETESKGVPIGKFLDGIATKLAIAEQQAEETYDLLLGIQNLMADRDKGQVGGISGTEELARWLETLPPQIETARGELNEFANSSEMMADSVARATQELAYLDAAARLAWQGQQNLNAQWTAAQDAVGFWETNLQNAETALDILNRQQEQNGGLTEEQQRQYDLLTEAQGRYKGGIEDEEQALVNAAVAQAEFINAQDHLNQLLADGKIAPADYAREMANLTATTDPATSSAYNLAGAQGDLQLAIEGVVNKLGNLLIDLGLLPESKRTEFQTPGMDDAKRNVDELQGKIDDVPSSMVITAHVDILQAQNALNELRGMTFTQSPPKKGPMAFVPNWNYLFEGLVESAETYGTQAMERLRSFVTRIDLDSIVGRQADLQGDIANLTAVRDAMAEIGDADAVAALNAELERLSTEAANLAGIVGTDAVQAWIRNENAMKAQAEQAERVREVQEQIAQATQTAVMVLSEGGNAASSYFERIIGAYEDARDALDMAQLLGLPAEVIDGLQEDFDDAALVVTAGTEQLQAALLAGLLDPDTLLALADAGGEWFRALYDSLFGDGALAEWQAGLNKLVEKTAYTGRVAASAITGELGGGGSAFSSASSAARALSAEASNAIRAAGAAANQTGYIIGARTTAKADAEIAELRSAITAAQSLDEKVSLAYHLKILLENRDRDLANLDFNSDGMVTRDELIQAKRNEQAAKADQAYATGPGSEAGVMAGWGGVSTAVSDGIVDGHRRVITGSRRSTTLVRA